MTFCSGIDKRDISFLAILTLLAKIGSTYWVAKSEHNDPR